MVRFVVLAALVGCGVDITGAKGHGPTQGVGGDAGTPVVPGSDGGVALDATPGLSVRGFLHEAGVKQCNEAFKCIDSYPGTQSQFEADWGTSADNCYDITDELFQIIEVIAEVVAGNIAFDPASAEACLEGITYGGCTTFWQQGAQFPSVCSQALVGSAPNGAACVVDYDCADVDDICTNNTCSPAQ